MKKTLFVCNFLILSLAIEAAELVGTGKNGMVVTADSLATAVGVEILKKGGNAVDAAIAVNFAMAVTYPEAGNIGGGGFMVIRFDDATETLDYREKAPMKATRDMYLDSDGFVDKRKSRYGILAAGVPGAVAGNYAAWEKYGTLKWNELIQPAIDFAKFGFTMDGHFAAILNGYQKLFEMDIMALSAFQPLDSVWRAGDVLVQPELAWTLEKIAENGRDGFYEGEVAKRIVRDSERLDGLFSLEDFSRYEAIWRKPISVTYENWQIYSMPPPSSGGICVIQLLNFAQLFPLEKWGFQSANHVHFTVESQRRVFADRSQHLGDSDFWNVPVSSLVNESYAKQLKQQFKYVATPSSEVLPNSMESLSDESEETTHFSIMDKWGNAVSNTTTINGWFGCGVVVADCGFFLNNEMDDFSAKPGVPNQFGLIGAEANAIEPEKRMLSSMSPTIATNGTETLVIGSPGGSTIITTVFQVLQNYIGFGMSLEEAVQSPRFHSQWLPDRIDIEEGFPKEIQWELQLRGHSLNSRKLGQANCIVLKADGTMIGIADRRRGGGFAKGF